MSKPVEIRRLNDAGITQFRNHIEKVQDGAKDSTPINLLTDPEYSVEIDSKYQIDLSKTFTDRYDFAVYAWDVLKDQYVLEFDNDKGFWSWLALAYFDQFKPADGANDEVHYIFSPENRQRWYRHCALTPVFLYRNYGNLARVILTDNMSTMGSMVEYAFSRQYLMRSELARKLIMKLYADPSTGRVKKGAASNPRKRKTKKGNVSKVGYGGIERFARVVQRIKLTHNVEMMDPDDALEIMGPEFKKWLPLQTTTP